MYIPMRIAYAYRYMHVCASIKKGYTHVCIYPYYVHVCTLVPMCVPNDMATLAYSTWYIDAIMSDAILILTIINKMNVDNAIHFLNLIVEQEAHDVVEDRHCSAPSVH